MDRYDREDRPSIFPQSEDEFDDAQPASSESLAPYVDLPDSASTRRIGPRRGSARRSGRRPQPTVHGRDRRRRHPDPRARRVRRRLRAADRRRSRPDGGLAGAHCVAATIRHSVAIAEPNAFGRSPIEQRRPSPTLRPQPATPLLAGQWATVVTDLVNLRSTPRLVASVVGQAGRGEIVFVLASEAPVEIDGFTWYQVVADPNEVGWVAGHGPTEQLAASGRAERRDHVVRPPHRARVRHAGPAAGGRRRRGRAAGADRRFSDGPPRPPSS